MLTGDEWAAVLIDQRDHRVDGGAYKAIQCDFAYNSNHIEGSTLTHEQTVQVFDRGTFTGTAKVDDIVEARNHFRTLDLVLDTYKEPLTPTWLQRAHGILKAGTADAARPVMAVGDFKRAENIIVDGMGGIKTARPHDVPRRIKELCEEHAALGRGDGLDGLARLHWEFERIHPFSDGNGRIGRLVIFRECMRLDLEPLIIGDELRPYYLRGLREFDREPGYLVDTLGTAQDRFAARYDELAESWLDALGGYAPVDEPPRDSREDFLEH